MKKIITICTVIAFACCICTTASAKIWRVNNTPGIAADFTTAQAAHDGALVGDTLHFEPSTANYGALTMTKRLVMIGTGNFLAENPGLQYTTLTSTLGLTSILPSASGSVIMLNFNSSVSVSPTAFNISMIRCKIDGDFLSFNNVSNSIIQNCFVRDLRIQGGSSGISVNNNIIFLKITMDAISSATLVNNVVNIEGLDVNGATNIFNSTVQNNIFGIQIGGPGAGLAFASSIVQNNICNSNRLPAGSGNQNNIDFQTVFVGDVGGNINGNVDNYYVLLTTGTNPAIGTGVGGVDCGVFGGSSPFKLGMIPPIPTIYKFVAPSAPSGNTLNITISTRSNN